jgi:hypothetical protein
MLTYEEAYENLCAQQPWVDEKYRQNRHVKTVNLRVHIPGVDYIDRR